jgi:hypothetical protein
VPLPELLLALSLCIEELSPSSFDSIGVVSLAFTTGL